MRLTFKQLKNMDVETLSGTKLGKVYDFTLDMESSVVIQLAVKKIATPTIKYLINTKQIIDIVENKLIVEDNIEKENNSKYPKNITTRIISSI